MKILHLFSNWKWTGPAEPALTLAAEQARRGHEVVMAVGDPGGGEAHFHDQVRARGVELLDGMDLSRHVRVVADRKDVGFLAGVLRSRPFDFLHAHMMNDHLIAGRARRRLERPPRLVRTSYDELGLAPGLRSSYLLRRHTDALVVSSHVAMQSTRERFPFVAERLARIEPAVDTVRFDAGRALPDRRREFEVDPDGLFIGLVARVQARRRFDVFLEAVALARENVPGIRAVILGNASPEDLEMLIRAPARELGIEERVTILSRQRGDDYVALLAALDLEVFLVPGSDESCRAVREALSMGLPVIGARRGMIPEIVEDGVTGAIVDDEPERIAEILVEWAMDRPRMKRLGAAAAESARRRFDVQSLGDRYEEVYESARAH